eukprot:TRINITY_DN2799_c0_g1_i1.p1 TRINITY_DN2799_c0_g1~~TRINITY_DN2799_c0_g1_i1.p1  ORF type:complete len:120 (+),score=0.33 TRINITY_DN2799_c0_g1_i1:1307-1666(+)
MPCDDLNVIIYIYLLLHSVTVHTLAEFVFINRPQGIISPMHFHACKQCSHATYCPVGERGRMRLKLKFAHQDSNSSAQWLHVLKTLYEASAAAEWPSTPSQHVTLAHNVPLCQAAAGSH